MPNRPEKNPAETAQPTTSRPGRLAGSQAPDIEHLVREIQAGRSKDDHFQQLFRHYLPSMVYFFVNRGLSKEDAEDLTQEVLVSVYKNVGKFRLDASFDTWLFRIMINVWKNALRHRDTFEGRAENIPLDRIVERVGNQAPGAALDRHDPAEDPLQRVLTEERTRLLLEALEQLPPKMRQCVQLRLGQGLRNQEIADLMEVSITTVKTHLRTAYQRLRPLLEKQFNIPTS